MICGRLRFSLQVGALVVPEGADHGVHLLGEKGGGEAEAHVAELHRVGIDARVEEDRAQVGLLIVDARVAHLLARQVLGRADLRVGQRDDRGERLPHQRAHRDHFQALVARPQQLRLIRHGEVHAPGRDLLDRRRGVRRLADVHLQPGVVEVPARLRRVDARVVGVREEVEHQADLGLALGAERVLLLATAGEHGQGGEKCREGDSGHAVLSSVRFHGVAIRSARVARLNSATAMRVRITIPAYTRGV